MPRFSHEPSRGVFLEQQADVAAFDLAKTSQRERMHSRTASPLSPWQRAGYATARPAATAPPQPLPWKPAAPSERISRRPEQPEPPKPRKKSLVHRLFSLRGEEPKPYQHEPKNFARGVEAAQRYVREGILDPRYRPAARRVTAIICALPLAVVLGYVLFQRRFMGVEQKTRPIQKDVMPEVEKEGAIQGTSPT